MWSMENAEKHSVQFNSVVSDSVTPWTAACQDSLSITNSQSPPKPLSIESGMPSSHLILCPLPALNLSQHQGLFKWVSLCIRWPNYWNFSSASVLPMNIKGWFSLGLTGLISLLQGTLKRTLIHSQWLGLGAFTAMTQIQSLVEDPFRSHKLCGMAKGSTLSKILTHNFQWLECRKGQTFQTHMKSFYSLSFLLKNHWDAWFLHILIALHLQSQQPTQVPGCLYSCDVVENKK